MDRAMEQGNGPFIWLYAVYSRLLLELYSNRPRDYLTSEVFPTMIPALNQMLKVAKVTEVSIKHKTQW